MSLRSESRHVDVVVSASELPEEAKRVAKTANEVSGYSPILKTYQAVRKSLGPIGAKVRNKTLTSQDVSVYASNEYVFAKFQIALALLWDKDGEEICESMPLTVILTILTHCLSATDPNNYSIRTLCGGLVEIRFEKGLCRSHRSAIFSKTPRV